MRAIVIREPGDEDVLVMGDVPAPPLGPADLRIKVTATAVNRADLLQRQGMYPPPPGASDVLGLECAGDRRGDRGRRPRVRARRPRDGAPRRRRLRRGGRRPPRLRPQGAAGDERRRGRRVPRGVPHGVLERLHARPRCARAARGGARARRRRRRRHGGDRALPRGRPPLLRHRRQRRQGAPLRSARRDEGHRLQDRGLRRTRRARSRSARASA